MRRLAIVEPGRPGVRQWVRARSTEHTEQAAAQVRLQQSRIARLECRKAKVEEAYFADAMDFPEVREEQRAIDRLGVEVAR